MLDNLNLGTPLSRANTPNFAEQLEIAARVVETALVHEGFTRVTIGRAENIPLKAKSREDVRLTYVRDALTATVDIFEDDCQYTTSHRCFSFRATLDAGRASEGMPYNRHRGGQPSRQQWRQRTDAFLNDLCDQLELMSSASQEGRMSGVISELCKGYGFIRSPVVSRLFFHRAQLLFSSEQIRIGQAVTFTLGENSRGRLALDIALANAPEKATRAQRDHATASPAPDGVYPIDAPPGADAQGLSVGRITCWEDNRSYGFVECLASSRVFIHRSALPELRHFGSQLRQRGVMFRLAKDVSGRLSAIDAHLTPDHVDVGSLIQTELGRWSESAPENHVPTRFHRAAPHTFDCTREKRPTVTVAALKDIITNSYLVFIHTRWIDLTPLQSTVWLNLAQGVVDGWFLGCAPDTILLSTHDTLYRLDGLRADPRTTVIPDQDLKRQLEAATPHPDD